MASPSEEIVWMNGEFLPLADARVPLEDRGLLFADGIYEVIAAYDGVPILLEEHLDRWERSAAGLRIQPRFGRDTRAEVIHELLRRFRSPRISIYGQLTRGAGRRAHVFPASPRPMEFWFAREMPNYAPVLFTEGASAITHPDERWAQCWIKSTSLLPNCLARQAAQESGAFEAVLYQEDETVTEGSVANFYVVKDGKVFTHPATRRILAGCKRRLVLSLARTHGIPVREEQFKLDFLRGADEAFLTSTTINVLPVTRCDGKLIGDGRVGPVVQNLMALTESAVQQIRNGSVALSR